MDEKDTGREFLEDVLKDVPEPENPDEGAEQAENIEREEPDLLHKGDEAPPVDRSTWKKEPEKKPSKIIKTEKHSGRLYPCTLCGKEKVKQSRHGNIPKYCKECLKKVQAANLKAARAGKLKERAFEDTQDFRMPDGSIAKVRDDDERQFLTDRVRQYKEDFDWKESSDYGLLTSLLLLELEKNRVSKLLSIKFNPSTAKSLSTLSEEIRQVQNNLGIARGKRLDEKEQQDAYNVVQDMMKRFNEYRKEHPERFMWRCTNCGHIQSLKMENPEADAMCNIQVVDGASNTI